jgi:hypothetical protein
MGKAVTPPTAKQTRHWAARVSIGLLAYLFVYVSASLAIDRGSLLAYMASFAFLVLGTRELLLAVRDSWARARQKRET